METVAVVLEAPERLTLSEVGLNDPGPADIVVRTEWTGVSTGTERLLFDGRMPPFPGLGYPLVPGYETVGVVETAGPESGLSNGDHVFVPGANCYRDVRGLFGGAAARLVVPGARVTRINPGLAEDGVLLALAATAIHAVESAAALPDLIIGHGVLGRLMARIVVARGGRPTVWETNPARQDARGYAVMPPDTDPRADYPCICDVSGDSGILDSAIPRLAHGGEIVLAGFYSDRVGFAFPPAFMREARIRIAAEFRPDDLATANRMIAEGQLRLDGLITHRSAPTDVAGAYRTAFETPDCLKMIIDWRTLA